MKTKPGKVIFIGAGPGNPDLITIKGAKELKTCDLVIYDRLVSPEILEIIPKTTAVRCAEEMPGCHPERIESIVKIMVESSLQGLKVARLKGGDPLLFGRGQEEIDPLVQKNIPFEIIPGVTAALGASAYSGFPLTDRDLSSAVAFITGHEKAGKVNSMLDWANLAHFKGSLVFYMGIKRASVIQENLILHGRSPETPLAIISNATSPNQKSYFSKLADLSATIQANCINPPSLIVVGEVAGKLGSWNWASQLPLAGAKILIARPIGQESELTQDLRDLGADVKSLHSMEIVDPPSWQILDDAISQLDDFSYVVFTSVNGVRKFVQRLTFLGKDLRALGKTKIACIGEVTALELEAYHLKADLIPKVFNSDSLTKDLAPLVQGKKVLLARAMEGKESLRLDLSKVSTVVDAPCYAQKKPNEEYLATFGSMISEEKFDYVFATSPNIAKLLIPLIPSHLASTKIVSISPLTDSEFEAKGYKNRITSEVFTTNGMIEVTIKDWKLKRK